MSRTKKVLTNTLTLYIRLGFLSIISLVTVKLTLNTLGEIDYGLNNVLSSVVLLSSFITASMSISAQRYFAIALKKNDWIELSRYFSLILNLFIVLIFLVVLFFETIGLWFILNKLVIPVDRIQACIIVYEISLFNFALVVFSLPFSGLIIADENFKVYSLISIIDGFLKVMVAFFLYISIWDKLVTLALLTLVVSAMTSGMYITYSLKKYRLLKYRIIQKKSGYKELISYMNWNLIGAAGSVGKIQGLNIVLNMFFGGSVNAARALATQVRAIINSFSASFMSAVNPQITKSYAGKENDRLEKLVVSSSKMSFFLLYIIILPFIFNMRFILHFWLGDTLPEFTAEFILLILIDMLIQVITSPIGTAVAATGKVRNYQLNVGILQILNIPVAYFAIRLTNDPLFPFITSIIISIIITYARINQYKKINSNFKYVIFFKKVFRPILLVVIPSVIITKLFYHETDKILIILTYVFIIVLYTSVLILMFGINSDEKFYLKNIFKDILKR